MCEYTHTSFICVYVCVCMFLRHIFDVIRCEYRLDIHMVGVCVIEILAVLLSIYVFMEFVYVFK